MLSLSVIAVALSTLSLASAQSQNFTIDVNAVDAGTKATWCRAEINVCNTLCGPDNIQANNCDPPTLQYNCTCADSNSSPPLEEYTDSMPFNICQQAYRDCMALVPNDARGQTKCKTDIQDKCGEKKPELIQFTPTSTPEAPSPSATGNAEPTDASATPSATVASSSSSTGAAAATHIAMLGNGAAVVAAGLFAALL